MNRTEIGLKQFSQDYACSQSVLYAFADLLEVSPDTALKLATGFGAGIGRKQEVCGAVSGGVMALSLLYGRGEKDGPEKKENTYAKVKELLENFKEEHGSFICKELLDGCDLLTPEGQKRFAELKMLNRCDKFVASAIRLTENIINRAD